MLQLNNTQMKIMTTTMLKSLQIMKPEKLRIIDNSKVNDIINTQLDFYKKHNYFNFSASNPLNINYYKDQYWLIDGQHRLAAMETLYTNHGHNIEIYVLIVNVNSDEEMRLNYEMINENTPLPDFSLFEDVDKKIPETVALHFQALYPKIWAKTPKAKKPYVYFNYFQESLAYICDQTNIKDVSKLQEMIINYNNKLSKWDKLVFKIQYNINDVMYNVAKEQGFYLGLFTYQSNEEYGFQWAKDIVEEYTGNINKEHTNENTNEKIKKNIFPSYSMKYAYNNKEYEKRIDNNDQYTWACYYESH